MLAWLHALEPHQLPCLLAKTSLCSQDDGTLGRNIFRPKHLNFTVERGDGRVGELYQRPVCRTERHDDWLVVDQADGIGYRSGE